MAATAEGNSRESSVPNDIDLNSVVIGIAMHPNMDVLAAGTIDGPVKIYSYTAEKSKSNHKVMSFRNHKDSCRTVAFSDNGDFLFTGSGDKSVCVVDLVAGNVTRRLTVKEGSPIYSLLSINEHLLASGDDDGRLIVWDLRGEVPVMCLKPCDDFISCLAVSADEATLLAACGEGTLSSFNLRSRKLDVRSETFTDEFLSLAIIKDNTKVIVSAGDGALNIFNFGEFGNISDRFPLHSGSIDAIVPMREDVLLCGCEDGNIRTVQIHPNRNLGVVGTHDDLPVEGLCISHDKKFAASSSHDQKVKFHDLASIKDIESELETRPTKNKKIRLQTKQNEFFKGL